jgi:glutaconate CoA-transferase subunit B
LLEESTSFRAEELLASSIAGLISDARHVAVGASSPIPAAAAMLARERGGGRPYVSLLGSRRQSFFTDGSFGSAYLYYVVPKVILFRLEHTRRTLVEKVDFISAPGASADNVHRSGGPCALITNRCLFAFDRGRRRFTLASVHPGHTVAEVVENTGFAFDRDEDVPTTPAPSREDLRILRTAVAPELVEVYPQFAAHVFGVRQTA